MATLVKNKKNLCAFIALACLLAAIGLAITSAISYPKLGDSATDALKKTTDVQKYQNLAMVLVVASISFYLACGVM
uniref:Transmembrane protein n=1 Tax=Iridovirus LCIVAC01 TaxID=2506607 RepID=A0A481YQ35_9VIRU|nr:MAG: hypothetical protein LCIVAC01_01300 [Iridovirus LCIVAC01]